MRLSDLRSDLRAPRRDFRNVKRRNRLVEQHVFLVLPVARRLGRALPRWVEFDELLADGALGLLVAAARFDRKRGVPFPRFAMRYVRGAMIDGVRRRRRLPLVIPNCDATVIDPRFQQIDDRADASALLSLIRQPRRRLALVLYYFDELTMKRVARRMGVSEPRVSRLVNESLESLRRRAA